VSSHCKMARLHVSIIRIKVVFIKLEGRGGGGDSPFVLVDYMQL